MTVLLNPGPRTGEIWRLVEAQHKNSTMKLVDNAKEQLELEVMLNDSKPPVPIECDKLHYLLYTPFRYKAHTDSRFRRMGTTPGVYYAAENIETSVAEIAFWRLLFFVESPGLSWPANPLELTGFAVNYHANLCIDLTNYPYEAQRLEWLDPINYTACHQLADQARQMDAEAIRYQSARDPEQGINISLLTCLALSEKQPKKFQSWHMKLSSSGVYARCEEPTIALDFDRDAFARDPRIADFDWDRPV